MWCLNAPQHRYRDGCARGQSLIEGEQNGTIFSSMLVFVGDTVIEAN